MISTIGIKEGRNFSSDVSFQLEKFVVIRFVNPPDPQEGDSEKPLGNTSEYQEMPSSAPLASMPSTPGKESDTEGYSLLPVVDVVKQHYFRVKELTQKPTVIGELQTYITIKDTSNDFSVNSTILRLFINEDGEVDEVRTEATGLSSETIAELTEIFKKAKFTSGKINNVAVKSQLRIEVTLDYAFNKFELNHLSSPAPAE